MISVYVDLKYIEISLTFTAGYVCLCGVCIHVVVLFLSVSCVGCGECNAYAVVCEYTERVRG